MGMQWEMLTPPGDISPIFFPLFVPVFIFIVVFVVFSCSCSRSCSFRQIHCLLILYSELTSVKANTHANSNYLFHLWHKLHHVTKLPQLTPSIADQLFGHTSEMLAKLRENAATRG